MHLRRHIRKILEASAAAYEKPLGAEEWEVLEKRFHKMGFLELGQVLSLRQNKRLGKAVHQLLKDKRMFSASVTDQRVDLSAKLPESRMNIIREVVAELRSNLNVAVPENPRLFIRRVSGSEPFPEISCAPNETLIRLSQMERGKNGASCSARESSACGE